MATYVRIDVRLPDDKLISFLEGARVLKERCRAQFNLSVCHDDEAKIKETLAVLDNFRLKPEGG